MKLFKKLDNLFAAAAFAEEGEFETAREIAAEKTRTGSEQAVEDSRCTVTPIGQSQLVPKA